MIRVKNLSKNFGPVKAVDNISFHVREGEILGFLGPNGAGKSTTMRIITCFIPPTSGTVSVGPYDIFSHSRNVRQIIGYLPENAPLYPEMRVYQYLAFRAGLKGVPESRINERIEAVMDMCNITDIRNKINGHLSKGYRQRVGIADCMLHEPRVLILDEPTVGLDPLQVKETRKMFQDLRQKSTIVISTHILSEVEMTCDRALIINKGKIVAEESIKDLTEEKEVIMAIEKPEGSTLEEISTAIQSLVQVAELKKSEEEGEYRFEISCKGVKDARNALSLKAREKGWRILELKSTFASLEDVFQNIIEEEDGTDVNSIVGT